MKKTMTISLPEPLRRYVELRAYVDGYGSVSEYIRELLRSDQQRFAPDLGEAVEQLERARRRLPFQRKFQRGI